MCSQYACKIDESIGHGSPMFVIKAVPTNKSSLQGEFCMVVSFNIANLSSVDGVVNLWDLRFTDAVVQSWETFSEGLQSFDVHPNSNVFIA
jgi:hypothetical protein